MASQVEAHDRCGCERVGDIHRRSLLAGDAATLAFDHYGRVRFDAFCGVGDEISAPCTGFQLSSVDFRSVIAFLTDEETCGLSIAVAHEVHYLSEVRGPNLTGEAA